VTDMVKWRNNTFDVVSIRLSIVRCWAVELYLETDMCCTKVLPEALLSKLRRFSSQMSP
jgi:hypothetical protein